LRGFRVRALQSQKARVGLASNEIPVRGTLANAKTSDERQPTLTGQRNDLQPISELSSTGPSFGE